MLNSPFFQLTGLPTTSGAVGTKAAPKQAVAADADADLQARLIYLTNLFINFTKSFFFPSKSFCPNFLLIFLVFFYQNFVQGNTHKTAHERNYGKEFCFTTSKDQSEPRAASNAIMWSANQIVRQKHVIGSKRGNANAIELFCRWLTEKSTTARAIVDSRLTCGNFVFDWPMTAWQSQHKDVATDNEVVYFFLPAY